MALTDQQQAEMYGWLRQVTGDVLIDGAPNGRVVGTYYGVSDLQQKVAALAATVGQVPEQTPAYWRKQPVPAILSSYLKQGAYANALRGDGQTDKALAEGKIADLLLIQADDAAFAGQGN